MQEYIATGFVAIAKFIVRAIIWDLMLFNVGRVSLLMVTLGQYPRGLDAQRNDRQISLCGVFVLVLAWSIVAICNNTLGVRA